jgi:hypothetical protein
MISRIISVGILSAATFWTSPGAEGRQSGVNLTVKKIQTRPSPRERACLLKARPEQNGSASARVIAAIGQRLIDADQFDKDPGDSPEARPGFS